MRTSWDLENNIHSKDEKFSLGKKARPLFKEKVIVKFGMLTGIKMIAATH